MHSLRVFQHKNQAATPWSWYATLHLAQQVFFWKLAQWYGIRPWNKHSSKTNFEKQEVSYSFFVCYHVRH